MIAESKNYNTIYGIFNVRRCTIFDNYMKYLERAKEPKIS